MDVAFVMQASGTTFNPFDSLQALRSPGRAPTTFPPDMRVILFALLMMSVAGCRCSPANPQPVKLRVLNTTRLPIYLDGTGGKLGLGLQREVNGEQFPFDDLACPCRFCSNACDTSCTCPDAGTGKVVRLEAGASAERTWDGVVQLSGFNNCSTEGCLDQQNAPLNEPFTLELCFSAQKPEGVIFGDGGVGNGALPRVTTTCTTRQFAPQDLEVEISPPRGSACTTTSECKGEGELCLDGSCTTGCPANTFPVVGAEWILTVANPDDMDFFQLSARPQGNQRTGTGQLTSALYQSGRLSLSFSRPGALPGQLLTGGLQVTLPGGNGPALTVGRQVSLLILDDGDTSAPSRAFVMKDAATGEVLFAADMGQGGRLVLPTDLGPFNVEDGQEVVGCSLNSCGRLLYYSLRFERGADTLDLLPGDSGELSIGSSRWKFFNVSSGAYGKTTCPVKDLRPWVFWKL